MAVKFTDTSAYQPSNLAYFSGLKEDGAKFNFTKLTEGTYYLSPAAGKQMRASKKLFGQVGVYHFWHGESAHYFLSWLKEYAKYVGFKLSDVKVALDVEATDLPTYVTSGVNQFETQLVHAGIKPVNIWTYVSASWVNEGRFNPTGLKYGFVWEAMYPYESAYADNELSASSSMRPNANAWQFSGMGDQDWSYGYGKAGDTLANKVAKPSHHNKPANKKPVKHENKKVAKRPVKKPAVKPKVAKPAPKPKYATHIGYYQTQIDKMGVFANFDLKDKLSTLPKDAVLYGLPVINGGYTRLLLRSGNFVSGNLKYIRRI